MKDFASRHPDWIGAETPPYTIHDARYDLKLANAVDWLRGKEIWRGEAKCRHVYRNSDGKRIEK